MSSNQERGSILKVLYTPSNYPYFASYRGSCQNRSDKHCRHPFVKIGNYTKESIAIIQWCNRFWLSHDSHPIALLLDTLQHKVRKNSKFLKFVHFYILCTLNENKRKLTENNFMPNLLPLTFRLGIIKPV